MLYENKRVVCPTYVGVKPTMFSMLRLRELSGVGSQAIRYDTGFGCTSDMEMDSTVPRCNGHSMTSHDLMDQECSNQVQFAKHTGQQVLESWAHQKSKRRGAARNKEWVPSPQDISFLKLRAGNCRCTGGCRRRGDTEDWPPS